MGVRLRGVVVLSADGAERVAKWGNAGHVPMAELARRQGVGPVASVDDLIRPGAFESDEELDEFLADLYASRHAGLVSFVVLDTDVASASLRGRLDDPLRSRLAGQDRKSVV